MSVPISCLSINSSIYSYFSYRSSISLFSPTVHLPRTVLSDFPCNLFIYLFCLFLFVWFPLTYWTIFSFLPRVIIQPISFSMQCFYSFTLFIYFRVWVYIFCSLSFTEGNIFSSFPCTNFPWVVPFPPARFSMQRFVIFYFSTWTFICFVSSPWGQYFLSLRCHTTSSVSCTAVVRSCTLCCFCLFSYFCFVFPLLDLVQVFLKVVLQYHGGESKRVHEDAGK